MVEWLRVAWTAERVRTILAAMREGAAPGQLGIPLAVWKSLPAEWHASLAHLLQLVAAVGDRQQRLALSARLDQNGAIPPS